MTFGDACAALGVETIDGMTPDELRRTYMRRLRLHPPEHDPDGFARVRAAFEQLRGFVAAREHMKSRGLSLVIQDDGRILVQGDLPAEPVADPADVQASAEAPEPAQAAQAAVPDVLDMEQVTQELLALLLDGKLDDARELERTWRIEHGGDDCTRDDPGDVVWWSLTRELVDVCRALPMIVVRPLAVGIRERDFDDARSTLRKYRANAAWQAANADALLERSAKSLHAQVRGCLSSPPRAQRPVQRPSSDYRHLGWVVAVLLMVVLRAIDSGSSDRDRYVPPPREPIIVPSTPATTAPPTPVVAEPRPPPPPDPALNRTQRVATIVEATARIARPDGHSSPAQRKAAAAVTDAAKHGTCELLVRSGDALDRAPPLDDRAAAAPAADEIQTIDAAIAALCPDVSP